MAEKRFEYVRRTYHHYIHDIQKDGEYKKEYRGTYDEFDLDKITDLLNHYEEENKRLKSELRIYRKVASCSNCEYHNYKWNVDDGYGGDEYEVCDKGNDVSEGICEEWEGL